MQLALLITVLYWASAGILTSVSSGGAEVTPSRLGRIIAAIGRRSYSIYLWHMPVNLAVRTASGRLGLGSEDNGLTLLINVALSVIVGAIAAQCVEFQVEKIRDRFFPRLP